MTVTTLFAATFPALALAHFVALLSPGPDFFLIMGHAVRQRLQGAAWICVGIALGNAIYILLAVAGWAGMKDFPQLYRIMELAGACYLAWMARMLWISSRSPVFRATASSTSLTPIAQLCAGLASALLNPKNAVFYLSLMTGILGSSVSVLQQAVAGTWMVLVVLIWDLGVAACIGLPSVQFRLQALIPIIEKTAAIVLGGMAIGIVFWG